MDNSNPNLNEAQSEALKQFKISVADILKPEHTDAILLKWLRARNCNPEKAASLYRKNHDARIFYEVEEIVRSYKKPEVTEKYGFTSFLGFAKDGSLVRYTHVGNADHYGFIMSLSFTEILRHAASIMEDDILTQRLENLKNGQEVNEMTYILDFDAFSLQTCAYRCVIEVGLDLTRLVQDYYPEIWGNIFCVNAPMYFNKAFNVFKPILRMNLLEKIQVVSREHTGKLLQKYIDDDILPVFLGGKRTDSTGDPRCSEFLKFGGKIPQKYFLRNRPRLYPSDPEVTSVWVRPGAVYNYSLEVPIAGSTLQAELRSENGSVFFKIFYRPFGDDPKSDFPGINEQLNEYDPKCRIKYASPLCRVQTHISPIDDKTKAPWPGIYIFQCDNTRSWFSYRRIIIRMKAIPPE